jgi:heme exporter protein B
VREFWNRTLAILWKDILVQLRTRDIISSTLVFGILVIVVFNFAFEPDSVRPDLVAPGILWVAFTFAGVLSLNRSFILEKEKDCLQGLMLCPVGREVLYAGKMLGCLLFMLLIEAIILPVFAVLFDLPVFLPKLAVITFLATVGFALVGTLFSALSVHTKAREVMMPVLFFPVVVPVIIAAVKASELTLKGEPWGELASWLEIIIAFDVVFLVVSPWVFGNVLEE